MDCGSLLQCHEIDCRYNISNDEIKRQLTMIKYSCGIKILYNGVFVIICGRDEYSIIDIWPTRISQMDFISLLNASNITLQLRNFVHADNAWLFVGELRNGFSMKKTNLDITKYTIADI
jgi:hypothetical protein